MRTSRRSRSSRRSPPSSRRARSWRWSGRARARSSPAARCSVRPTRRRVSRARSAVTTRSTVSVHTFETCTSGSMRHERDLGSKIASPPPRFALARVVSSLACSLAFTCLVSRPPLCPLLSSRSQHHPRLGWSGGRRTRDFVLVHREGDLRLAVRPGRLDLREALSG